ncbi:hypothetical protein M0802_000688 [Mischocyttarus mexicanus]|nr:hypothetical protein M0802_000688 [Mischocyttarus mexicanus]
MVLVVLEFQQMRSVLYELAPIFGPSSGPSFGLSSSVREGRRRSLGTSSFHQQNYSGPRGAAWPRTNFIFKNDLKICYTDFNTIKDNYDRFLKQLDRLCIKSSVKSNLSIYVKTPVEKLAFKHCPTHPAWKRAPKLSKKHHIVLPLGNDIRGSTIDVLD